LYTEGEEISMYVDHAAKYTSWQSLYMVALAGGHYPYSPCGDFEGIMVWVDEEGKECWPVTGVVHESFQYAFNKSMKPYLAEIGEPLEKISYGTAITQGTPLEVWGAPDKRIHMILPKRINEPWTLDVGNLTEFGITSLWGIGATEGCGALLTNGYRAVVELHCGYAITGSPEDADCSGGLSCAQFNDWILVQSGLGPDTQANGYHYCTNSLNRFQIVQPDQVMPGDFVQMPGPSEWGHTGMYLGVGILKPESKMGFEKICYGQFSPDPSGKRVYVHSYGWCKEWKDGKCENIIGGACFSYEDELFAKTGNPTAHCRLKECIK
jgi:hypothetical protein